jgi:hypothetical protein
MCPNYSSQYMVFSNHIIDKYLNLFYQKKNNNNNKKFVYMLVTIEFDFVNVFVLLGGKCHSFCCTDSMACFKKYC